MKRIIAVAAIVITTLILIPSCTPKMRGDMEVKVSQVEYNKTGLPVVDEPISFEVGVLTDQDEESIRTGNYEIFKIMEERTNISINWKPISHSGQVSKLVLWFVSNSYPEAFYGMWNRSADWQRMVDQGFLIPLDPYVEAGLMPNLAKKLEQRPELLDGIRMKDGHYYSLPRYLDAGRNSEILDYLHLNKKWMEALDLDPPEDLNDLYNILIAFRDGDPNGNGKQDEIPMSAVFSHQRMGLWSLFGSFGLFDNYYNHMMVRNGKVISPNIQAEYKEAIKFFNKLYEEKLLDLEFFSQTEEMFNSKIRNGQVGFWAGQAIPRHLGDRDGEDLAEIHEEILFVPPLKGFNGEEPIWPYFPDESWGSFEITNKCENPEVLLRWVDQFYDDEFGIQLQYGAWGQYMHRNDAGKIELIPPSDDFNPETITFPFGPRILTSPGIKDELVKSEVSRFVEDLGDLYAPYIMKERYRTFAYEKEDNRMISPIKTETTKLIENKQIAWITGESDIDEEWGWYIEELKKIGIEKEFEIYQKYYDEYLRLE